MSQGVEAAGADRAGRGLAVRAVLVERSFALGVAAITTAAGLFLAHQLMAWPPHEDEVLALFVGRDNLPGVIEHVTRDRGGAPLHFLVAWLVAHLGLGLGALRLTSAAFAVASLPLTATLGRRLVGGRVALVATALLAGAWIVLFHGVYGRMYSMFLFLSLLTFHALLRALDRPGRREWAMWVLATLTMVAAHPYGVLVLAGQLAFVVLMRRDRLGSLTKATCAVIVLGIPFWLTDLVLASRFDVGVGAGGDRLGGPLAVGRYFWRTAGDMSAGWWPLTAVAVALAIVGLATETRRARALTLCAIGAPALAFLLSRMGGSASPESRHLIFLAPLFAIAVAAGLVRLVGGRPLVLVGLTLVLVGTELAWARNRTPALFDWEPDQRQAARSVAEQWLATTGRPNDVLFGYEPLYLGAWERNRQVSQIVVPRADSVLALRRLRQGAPLGRGVWVLDASRHNNERPRLELDPSLPRGAARFEARAFGPFLVLRSREPTVTPKRFLADSARAELIGRSLGIGDADVNLQTVERAARTERGYGPSRWLRSVSSR